MADDEQLDAMWHQESNNNDNTNNKSALIKQSKQTRALGCNKNDNDDLETNDKKSARWASRRELADESSTRLRYLLEYLQLSQGQGQAPSSSYVE